MKTRIMRTLARALTRRRFLASSSALALTTACATTTKRAASSSSSSTSARVVIVGAGAAGLAAAHRLKKANVHAMVYEASARAGGRVRTAKDLLAPGITTELGAEFIDSNHAALLRLCTEFGLPLLDAEGPDEKELAELYFFDGHAYSEADVEKAIAELAPRIESDIKRVGLEVDYRNPGVGKALDDMPLAKYFDDIGAHGWVKKMLDAAFVTEFGLDSGEQSALNFINIYKDGSLWGDSDERYKIEGGNQRVTDALCRELVQADSLKLDRRLLRVASKGEGYKLTFALGESSAGTLEVDADVVLLTLPFSTLRDVDIQVELPPAKKRCIAELGMGTNAKVMTGVVDRRWRKKGLAGAVLSDERFMLAWDSSRMQPGTAGAISMFTGGKAGVECGAGTPEEQVAQMLPALKRALDVEENGKCARAHWPSEPYARGSYACYRPGQWTSIAGAEGEPVGKLFFAGEHTSREFQGYINGAVESGEKAADAILERVGVRRA